MPLAMFRFLGSCLAHSNLELLKKRECEKGLPFPQTTKHQRGGVQQRLDFGFGKDMLACKLRAGW